MNATGIARKIDDLMERASDALVHMRYFEAERMAVKGLAMAREANDFERMARIVMPLQEARRQRYQQALDYDHVTILNEPQEEDVVLKPGCYLVQPPLVGADARRFRLSALAHDVPVAVLCREPNDQLGLVPVVAITPGKTLRAKTSPLDDPKHPDIAWLVEAFEELGDFSLRCMDPEQETTRRIDALMLMLDALPEHEAMHIALEDACRAVLQEANNDRRDGTTSRKRRASGAGAG